MTMTGATERVLGIDASTARTSVALVDGDQVLEERAWDSGRGGSHALLRAIEDLLARQALSWDAIGRYAVGKGPGNYTGLRVSMALAQALALPGKQPVLGVCSAIALLLEGRQRHPDAPAITVVGDARRQHLWLYTLGQAQPPSAVAQQILAHEALATHPLPAGTCFLSPDHERLASTVSLPPDCTWDLQQVAPRAATIAQLATSLPPAHTDTAILYIHPPVFVPPAFPAGAAAGPPA